MKIERILLAIGTKIQRENADRILRNSNFQYRIISNSLDVLSILEEDLYHAIFIDLEMESGNGIEVLKVVRKHFAPPVNAIPAIALFTSQEKNNPDFLIANGFNWSLPVNFSLEDLNGTISWIANAEPEKDIVRKSSNEVNFEFFRQCSGNDKTFMMEMADLFYKTYPDTIQRLKRHHSMQDWKMIYFEAHKFSAQLAYLGLKEAYDYADSIESITDQGFLNSEMIYERILNLEKSCNFGIIELDKFIRQL